MALKSLLLLLVMAMVGPPAAHATESPPPAASKPASDAMAFPACSHGRAPLLLMQFQGLLELRVRASAAVDGQREVEVQIIKSTVDDRKVERRAIQSLSEWARQQPCQVGAFETTVRYEAQ